MCRTGCPHVVLSSWDNSQATMGPAVSPQSGASCFLSPRPCDSAAVAAAVLFWPLQDINAIRSSRQKVFQLYEEGKLQAWVDASHGCRGVEQIPQAIDYMLQGGHIGKVVIPL